MQRVPWQINFRFGEFIGLSPNQKQSRSQWPYLAVDASITDHGATKFLTPLHEL
jgi:hypothetical protein